MDTTPLLSLLPDVPSQTYTGLQQYTASFLEVIAVASPPENGASGKTLHYVPDIMVPEAARPGEGLERKGARYVGRMMETDLSWPRV